MRTRCPQINLTKVKSPELLLFNVICFFFLMAAGLWRMWLKSLKTGEGHHLD